MLLKWGIISTGLISEDFVKAVNCLPGEHHKVVAVAARESSKAAKFASQFEIEKSYGDYETLAKDPNIDVVYIGTINVYHYPVVKLILHHGKHVLCEKPLAMNLKQVQELINIASSKKLLLMQGIWSRCFPAYKRISEVIAQDVIGDVKFVNCNFGFPMTVARVSKKSLGGSCLLDIGIYCIQLILFAIGKVKPQTLSATANINDDGVDSSVGAIMKFPNGAMATFSASAEANYHCEASICGTKGNIKIAEPFWSPTKVQIKSEIEEFPIPCEGNDVSTNFVNSLGLQFEAEEVRQCLIKGLLESPLISNKETELITEIMDDIRSQIGVVYPED